MELLADMSLASLFMAAMIVFIGALIQGSIGMGFGLFTAPLLALLEPRLVPSLVLTLGMFAALMPAIRGRENIVLTELGIGMAGRLVGAIFSASVFASLLHHEALLLAFGLVVLFAVLLSLMRLELAFTNLNLMLASIVSGVMSTFTGVGAPPMGILYQRQSAAKIRATLNAFFAMGGLISFGSLYYFGAVDTSHFVVVAVLFPAMALGAVIAGFVQNPPAKTIRMLILTSCTISGLLLVLKGLDVL